MRKAPDPVIADTIKRGIRQTGMKRSDTAMLITNTSIVFVFAFVLKKATTSREFPSSEASAIILYIDSFVIVAAGVLTETKQKVLVLFLVKFATRDGASVVFVILLI